MKKIDNETIKEIKKRLEKVEGLTRTIIEQLSKRGNRTIKCHHCFYSWKTNSRMEFVSCPNCGFKVRIEENLVK